MYLKVLEKATLCDLAKSHFDYELRKEELKNAYTEYEKAYNKYMENMEKGQA